MVIQHESRQTFFPAIPVTWQEIIAQGELAADYFYICQSGKFEIFVSASLHSPTMVAFGRPVDRMLHELCWVNMCSGELSEFTVLQPYSAPNGSPNGGKMWQPGA